VFYELPFYFILYNKIKMPTLAMNMPLPQNARKNAPQPKSGGKVAPKSKRTYTKRNMDYWNKKSKR